LVFRHRSQAKAWISDKANCLAQNESLQGRPKNEEKPLPIDVGALGIDWLRRRTNDRDNDNDYAGSDNERSSPRNSGDQTSAISSR